jgi:S-(hydroxymethyl)glutathione dehydrogenase/alcohol dehydrogenase
MKAAVLHEVNKPMVIEEVGLRKPGPREVLLRTACAGLCHSDLHFIEGLYPHPLPAVLGHESAGIVEEVGSDVTYVKKGDHVVTCLSVFCGTCEQCLSGRPAICTNTDVKLLPGVSNRLTWNKTGPIHQFINMSSFAEQMLVLKHQLSHVRRRSFVVDWRAPLPDRQPEERKPAEKWVVGLCWRAKERGLPPWPL